MLTTYGAALCFVLASVLTGQGVAALAGRRTPWGGAPAAGMAVLLCVGALATRLPEGGVLGPILLGTTVVAAAAAALSLRPPWLPPIAFAVAALAFAVAAVPFYVSGRAGLLGVSLNNDTALHLIWAEALRSDTVASLYPLPDGYPLAPHALMAALGSTTGIAMDEVLDGLLIASAALTAMSALPLLVRLPPVARIAAAVLVAFAYLPAAYFGQGAFKEPLMAMFLVAFTALLATAREAGSAARPWLAVGVPAGLLAAGGVQVYSYLALAWFVAITATWLAVELALGGRRDVRGRLRAGAAAVRWPLVAAGAALAVAIAPQVDRVLSFVRLFGLSPAAGGIPVVDTGNLAGPLSPYEVLGVWPSADFRFPPLNAFHAGELGAVGMAVLLIGAVAALRRREAALVAAAGASLVVFWISERGQSPYVAAKALALAAPLVMALALNALPERGGRRWSERGVAQFALVAVFAVFAAYSTSLVLRGAPVASGAQGRELAALRPLVGSEPTLFLGNDDHAAWRLRDVALGSLQRTGPASPIRVQTRPQKPPIAGQPSDFDSIDAPTLDRFAYVIAPRSGYHSEPPSNFARVRSGRLYELWERRGPTAPRQTLETGDAPGAVLDCRRAGRRSGVASVWPAAPRVAKGVPPIAPGTAADLSLPLSRGRWVLSLQYTSSSPVRVLSRRGTWRLPANTAGPGAYFELGQIDVPVGGSLGFRVIAEQTARVGSRGAGANIGALAATRADAPQERPLRRSCGRYVDWYREG